VKIIRFPSNNLAIMKFYDYYSIRPIPSPSILLLTDMKLPDSFIFKLYSETAFYRATFYEKNKLFVYEVEKLNKLDIFVYNILVVFKFMYYESFRGYDFISGSKD